ncbi:serine hydrolase domain-containing protein [Aureibaculum conchae]|uniref:serine hydrolase domain-containing protein n=1 Tax=Aureibaculum sp. 2308TA14-22 TaxID=3108392 RepID=UPI0033911CC5
MNKIIYISIIATIFFSCTKEDPVYNEDKYACTSNIINTHPDATRFQNFIEEKVAQGLPGISMLIETPKGIWSGAAGVSDIPNNIKMKPCSLHKIGSITKTFTAALILKLYEQGKISLDDPISKYLNNGIVAKVANAETATIRQLLNHTSGITDYLSQLDYTLLNYYDNPTKVWTPMEELEYIYNEPADFEVGTKVEYSNSNYLLLGIIAENAFDLSGEQLYQSLIYTPLNLNNTHLYQNGDNPSNLVRGYFDESGKGSFIDTTPLRRFSNSMVGGMSSTVEDLNIFLKAAMTPNILFNQETIDDMLATSNVPFANDEFVFGEEYKVNKVSGIGLGWFKLDTDYGIAYGHNGGYNGRRARMWYFPESGSSIVFMFNGSGESIKSISRELFRNEMIELLFE